MRLIYVILTFSLIALTSCRKDPPSPEPEEPVDVPCPPLSGDTLTIEPLEYFPVFPGSYWTYLDTADVPFTLSVSGTYLLDQYEDADNNSCLSEPVWVPMYNENAIYGYAYPDFGCYESGTVDVDCQHAYLLYPFFSDQLGKTWSGDASYGGSASAHTSWEVMAVNTQVEVLGTTYFDVVVVKSTRHVEYGGPHINWRKWDYYAKNIGLVLREESHKSAGTTMSDTIPTAGLSSYFINN